MLAFLVLCNVLLHTQTVAHSTLHTFFPQIPSFLASVFGGGGGGTGGVHRLSTLYLLAVVVVELELLLFSNLIFSL